MYRIHLRFQHGVGGTTSIPKGTEVRLGGNTEMTELNKVFLFAGIGLMILGTITLLSPSSWTTNEAWPYEKMVVCGTTFFMMGIISIAKPLMEYHNKS